MRFRSGVVLLTLVVDSHAAELRSETAKAWEEYVHSATARIQERLGPENHFLKIDEDRDQVRRARSGESLISPGGLQSMKKVPSGVIHLWLGTAFIADVSLSEVLSVVRDYDRYKEFYHPTVISSKALARDDHEDRFSMVLMNKVLFLKTALDSDYQPSYVLVSDRR